MNFSDYLADKKLIILVGLMEGFFFSTLLWLFGLCISQILLLWICFLCITGSIFFFCYFHQRKRILTLKATMNSLHSKYLFAEIIEHPESILEQTYFQLMKTALKAMTDEVSASKRCNMEYQDFVEQWIHEMKVPIAGIQLLCENYKFCKTNSSDTIRKIMAQVEIITQNMERVLFYARLGSAEKDYLITEVSLKDGVLELLAQNKQFLIQNNVCVDIDQLSDLVYSDPKWLHFILNQIVINSVKYQGNQSLNIKFHSQTDNNYVILSITDNGIGIKESELDRVFEKGFVGSNGRAGKHATGIGLYLCKQLCAKLGIGIEIQSKFGQSTTVFLYFPKNNDLKI